jgi:diacylglycerol kinase family enzyme
MMKKIKIAFLINPVSGGRQGIKIYDQLALALKNVPLFPDQFQIIFTEKGGVVSQAQQLANQAEILIAVGGDGTAIETITGAYRSGCMPRIGLIPIGTGNDLARSAGLYTLFKKEGGAECVRRFLHGTYAPLDIWLVNKKELMTNYLSIGLDAAVIHSFHRQRMKLPFYSVAGNKTAFAIIGLSRIAHRIKGEGSVTCRVGAEKKTFFLHGHRQVIISNLPFYAGGAMLAPEASFCDGVLEVTPLLNIISALGLFAFQPSLRLRTWYGNKLKHIKAKRVELAVQEGNFLQIDGEDKTYLVAEKKIVIEHGGQISFFKKK